GAAVPASDLPWPASALAMPAARGGSISSAPPPARAWTPPLPVPRAGISAASPAVPLRVPASDPARVQLDAARAEPASAASPMLSSAMTAAAVSALLAAAFALYQRVSRPNALQHKGRADLLAACRAL